MVSLVRESHMLSRRPTSPKKHTCTCTIATACVGNSDTCDLMAAAVRSPGVWGSAHLATDAMLQYVLPAATALTVLFDVLRFAPCVP
jgi:hypothetical protein